MLASGALVYSPRDQDTHPLAARNFTHDGAAAVTHALSDHGVTIKVPASAQEAVKWGSQPDTTLVVVFPHQMSDDLAAAIQKVPRVLFIGTEWLYTDIDGASARTREGMKRSSMALRAQCNLTAALKADTIQDTVYGVRLGPGWTGCFPLGNGTYAYAQKVDGQRIRTIIADSSIPRNSEINKQGHAALVMNAIAPSSTVVWFTPQLSDTLADSSSVTPVPVMPVLVMMGIAALFLAFSWGRRLGRLVPEDLPGYVPAAETIAGRGRLLSRGKDRAHAARSLRIATAQRIAKARGISVHASPQALDSVDPQHVLRTSTPSNDKELLQLAQDLDTLEKDARP